MKAADHAAFAQRHWQRNGWLARLLQPFAALTGWHVERRRAQYRAGRRAVYRAPVPVVVIGNIYVGGTGKTPVAIATVEALRASGWTPGVVSRGYGARVGPQPRVGQGELAPSDFGDEPALIARITGAPVAVHPRRALAVQALLARHPEVDVIVSDDGLQHLALARDIEIVVQDERGVGNGRLLPAGPLREPASRLESVDVIITNRAPGTPPAHHAGGPRRADMWLQPGDARHLSSDARRPLADFADAALFPSVAAAAGIGNPQRYFATLRAAGLRPDPCLALPDHYDYRRSPFESVSAGAILITSKDAIKCRGLNDPRLWEVPVEAHFSDPGLFRWLAARLRQAIGNAPR